MADSNTIVKANALSEVLKFAFGEEPTIEYYDTYAKIYYQPDRLKKVQKKLEDMVSRFGSSASDIRFEFLPLITPLLIKKGFPLAVTVFSTGFLIGKRKRK